VDFLNTEVKVEIQLDPSVITGGNERLVSLNIKDVPFGDALDFALRMASTYEELTTNTDLGYVVTRAAIIISSKDKVQLLRRDSESHGRYHYSLALDLEFENAPLPRCPRTAERTNRTQHCARWKSHDAGERRVTAKINAVFWDHLLDLLLNLASTDAERAADNDLGFVFLGASVYVTDRANARRLEGRVNEQRDRFTPKLPEKPAAKPEGNGTGGPLSTPR